MLTLNCSGPYLNCSHSLILSWHLVLQHWTLVEAWLLLNRFREQFHESPIFLWLLLSVPSSFLHLGAKNVAPVTGSMCLTGISMDPSKMGKTQQVPQEVNRDLNGNFPVAASVSQSDSMSISILREQMLGFSCWTQTSLTPRLLVFQRRWLCSSQPLTEPFFFKPSPPTLPSSKWEGHFFIFQNILDRWFPWPVLLCTVLFWRDSINYCNVLWMGLILKTV